MVKLFLNYSVNCFKKTWLQNNFRAVSYEEMSRRVFPDFCPGWAYVTSTSFGVSLAQSAASIPEMETMKRLDDIFVTGSHFYS
jgi:hypothetical protein